MQKLRPGEVQWLGQGHVVSVDVLRCPFDSAIRGEGDEGSYSAYETSTEKKSRFTRMKGSKKVGNDSGCHTRPRPMPHSNPTTAGKGGAGRSPSPSPQYQKPCDRHREGLVVAKEEGGWGGKGWEAAVSRCKLSHREWIERERTSVTLQNVF